jgi:hypothetical protein
MDPDSIKLQLDHEGFLLIFDAVNLPPDRKRTAIYPG